MQSVTYRLQIQNMRPLMTTIWNNLQGWLKESPDLEISIRPYKSKRSTEQNRRLWKIYQTLAEQAWVSGKRFSQDAWHEYCKRQFIGSEELPDGSQIGISTTTLTYRRDDRLSKPHPSMGGAGIWHYLGILNERGNYDAKRANQTQTSRLGNE